MAWPGPCCFTSEEDSAQLLAEAGVREFRGVSTNNFPIAVGRDGIKCALPLSLCFVLYLHIHTHTCIKWLKSTSLPYLLTQKDSLVFSA